MRKKQGTISKGCCDGFLEDSTVPMSGARANDLSNPLHSSAGHANHREGKIGMLELSGKDKFGFGYTFSLGFPSRWEVVAKISKVLRVIC